jgi:hypothetical protein
MKRIVLDQSALNKLPYSLGPVELVDIKRNVLGVFTPASEQVATLEPPLRFRRRKSDGDRIKKVGELGGKFGSTLRSVGELDRHLPTCGRERTSRKLDG